MRGGLLPELAGGELWRSGEPGLRVGSFSGLFAACGKDPEVSLQSLVTEREQRFRVQ